MSNQDDPMEREANVARILGVFFLVLGLPVLAGSLFAEVKIDLILNLAAGALLWIVGGGFLWQSRRSRRSRRARRETGP